MLMRNGKLLGTSGNTTDFSHFIFNLEDRLSKNAEHYKLGGSPMFCNGSKSTIFSKCPKTAYVYLQAIKPSSDHTNFNSSPSGAK